MLKQPEKKEFSMGKKCEVVCVTNGKKFKSIKDAVKYAGAKHWTMNVKMSFAGGFKDDQGREYKRLTPMNTKNKYKDTGKEIQKIKGEYTRQRRLPLVDFIPKPQPQHNNDVVIQALREHIEKICKAHNCWGEVSALLDAMKIINQKD